MSRSLTKEMRVATRDVHKLSDALVNAKLAFALNNSEVWCDGLLVFYEIFKFLEENVSWNILPSEYHRLSQFEQDLEFYKGSDWKSTYKVRDSVQNYLDHLNKIRDRNPLLLIAYVYHLYMGLLSGGQILAKKRSIGIKFRKTFSEQRDDEVQDDVQPGSHLTSFPNESVVELKNKLRQKIDDFTNDFDDKLRRELIEESKKVFELNNTIINSVEGVDAIMWKNLRQFFSWFFLIVASVFVLIKMWNEL